MRRLVLLPALLAILVGAPPALAWTWPVDGPVLQPFTFNGDPYASGQHRGIDVGAAEDVAVRAPASGTVTFAGTVPTGGRSITIQTPDGFAVTLLHLGAVGVAEGDTVAEGTDVGVIGWSGDPEHTTPSVHLGVRIAAQDAGYLDPLSLLPPVAPSAPAADPQPDEPAVPPVEVEDDDAPAHAVEVTTLPSQPEAAGPAPESLPEVAQPLVAEPPAIAVVPVEPLTVVTVGSAEPAQAAPASESSQVAPAHPVSVTAAVEATSPPPTASAGDATRPAKAAAPSPASAPVSPDARPEGQQARADRLEPVGRPHRVRIDRRAEPFVDASVTPAPAGAGSIEPEARRRSHVREPERGIAATPAPSGAWWVWRGAFAVLLAALTVVLVTSRRRRGGEATVGLEVPPSAPPLGAVQAAELQADRPVALPAPGRDPRVVTLRFGRRLDRGGPGGPAKRPAARIRRRRASV